MATTKLKIDLTAGTLEVEGDESFVSRIYEEFKTRLSVNGGSITPRPKISQAPNETSPEARPRRAFRRETPAIVKDLDLSGQGDKPSLRDFHKGKSPSSAMESNTIFTYYLKQIGNLEKINSDHIYTCYKVVGVRTPTALKQSLLDTASRKGWIDASSMEDIRLTTHGKNLVEHDLPRNQED